MKIENWITIASALIIAIGWFVTAYLNRAKDIAQKRLEYRLKALEAFLPVYFGIQRNGNAAFAHPELLQQLADARSKLQLYGFDDEIKHMENFIRAIEEGRAPEANQALQDLIGLVHSRIREELNIK